MTPARAARSAASDDDLADLMRGIRRLVGVLAQSARAVEQSTGVTNAQLFVLRHLGICGACSINDIAAAALTHQSAVSVIVTRLENDGLVSRVRSIVDARRAEVALTAAGRRLLRSAPPPPTTRLLEALQQLPATKRKALGSGITSLLPLLGSDGDDEPMMLFEPAPKKRRARKGAKS